MLRHMSATAGLQFTEQVPDVGLVLLGIKVGRRCYLEQFAIVRHEKRIVDQAVRLIETIAFADSDFTFILDPKPRLARQHVNHLKTGCMAVPARRMFETAVSHADDMGAIFVAGRLADPQVAILEFSAQTGGPLRLIGALNDKFVIVGFHGCGFPVAISISVSGDYMVGLDVMLCNAAG